MLYKTDSKHLQKYEIGPMYTAQKNPHYSLKYFLHKIFPQRKVNWKHRLQNGGHFYLGLNVSTQKGIC